MHAGGQHHQELQFPAKYASNNPDSACTGRAVFYLNFDAGCSEDGVCPCQCNYASDPTCACRDIDGRISIHVTKSDVRLLYPLTYAKTINYYPIEQVHYGAARMEHLNLSQRADGTCWMAKKSMTARCVSKQRNHDSQMSVMLHHTVYHRKV
jgi:hypothetical protein